MNKLNFIYFFKSEGCKYCDLFSQSQTKKELFEKHNCDSALDVMQEQHRFLAKEIYKVKTVPALIVEVPNLDSPVEYFHHVVIDDFSSLSYIVLLTKITQAIQTYKQEYKDA